MATLMEKDALLNGASQCIAFLSEACGNIDNSEALNLSQDINQCITYRDYLYSTDADEVNFNEGVVRFKYLREKYYSANTTHHNIDINDDPFESVWRRLTKRVLTSQAQPVGFVLGGQPGAGKSLLIKHALVRTDFNALVINGDDFRFHHPDFQAIYATYGDDFVSHTAQFSGEMVERVLKKAIENKFNIVIEGTFRNADTPMQTLKRLKEAGYRAEVMIKTTSATKSWRQTNERYDNDKLAGNIARKVDKNHHDLVIAVLAENAKKVFDSGLADAFSAWSCEDNIFDSQAASVTDIEEKIRDEICKTVTA
ncbi:zeta toxin family protein [Pseudocitrobacter sp. 73]|uniref:zeta toxin family protein n=1 Tax=Pseudocitrobacter sp. 73 TaxID=2605731 RepID=UPI0011EF30AD|nr:zeta toxin family protein [Pseudocitrobacter sp. 73]KAA1051852.1 AAA family ATPase [Pseudocitrobacter sp. 73]